MINKPVLALETSGELCSIGLFFSKEKYFMTQSYGKMSHSKIIIPSVEGLLSLANLRTEDLGSIAVSIGPGSFTGLRIGLAAAKGIAFGASLPIIPVPSFEAIALQCIDYLPDDKPVAITIKVNHDEVYFNSFTINENSFNFTDEIRIIKKSELSGSFNDYYLVTDMKVPGLDKFNKLSQPSAYYVALWSYLFGEKYKLTDFDYLEPMYVKDFQVKRS
ncbi:MAG: tRNA (adenosine(37)-N6)-threonylcarbamoyltransferase complex dimerization subunit type 1 TsaB [Ignavibacteriaceae bacterium]